MSRKFKGRNLILSTLFTAVAFVSAAHATPGGSGGGASGPCGDLLDFCEENMDPNAGMKPFDPVTDPLTRDAVQQQLYPWLTQLEKRVPSSAGRILTGLKEMTWFVTDQPISAAGDSCTLLQQDGTPIGRQVGNQVVLSRQWIESHDNNRSRAGLILHELIEHKTGKDNAQCSTNVRTMVRYIDQMSKHTDEELRDQLAQVNVASNGAPLYTRSDANKVYAILKTPIIEQGCKKDGNGQTITQISRTDEKELESMRGFPGPGMWDFYYKAGRNDNDPASQSFLMSEKDCADAVKKLADTLGLPGNSSEQALIDLISQSSSNSQSSLLNQKAQNSFFAQAIRSEAQSASAARAD
jgi:hypothetical protein